MRENGYMAMVMLTGYGQEKYCGEQPKQGLGRVLCSALLSYGLLFRDQEPGQCSDENYHRQDKSQDIFC